MDRVRELKLSRLLSYILRHNPTKYNIIVSRTGYANIDKVCEVLKCTVAELEYIVSNDDKGRYAILNVNIRANQGHSIDVDIEYKRYMDTITPVYHATPSKNTKCIFDTGLNKGSRGFVHLTQDIETAIDVGFRYSDYITVLKIDVFNMINDGVMLFISDNNVILTEYVHRTYITIESQLTKPYHR